MDANETPTAEPPRKGRFQKGQSGNPKGKPRGKTAKTKIRELLSKGDIADIVATLAAKAKAGDVAAANILLARAYPIPKAAGRFLNFQIPTGLGLAGIAKMFDAILVATGSGALTTEEATSLASILEKQAKILEVDSVQQRLAAIESKITEAQKPRAITHG